MPPERLTLATTVTVEAPAESPLPTRADAKALADPCSQARPRPGDLQITSGLSYACRYCGRSHYPTCR
jgi:hypothetical protein